MCCPDITTDTSCPRNSRLCGKEVMVEVKEHFQLEETQIFGVSESAAIKVMASASYILRRDLRPNLHLHLRQRDNWRFAYVSKLLNVSTRT